MLSRPWVPSRRYTRRNAIPAAHVLVCSRLRRSIFRLTLALLIAGSWWGSFDEKVSGQVVTFPPTVRVIYLVPSDRAVRDDYRRHLDSAIGHVQIWLRNELGENLSFSTDKKPVEVLQTSHTASWYSENPSGPVAVSFFFNVLADGFALTGGQFNDPSNIWVFYIDAEPACGQLTGATSGVAVLPEHDLRGLAGEENIPTCPTDPVDTSGVCRWVGGLGHELGHALGLPHPLACEDGDPSTACPSDNLMWLGYITYPDTFLLENDKTLLEASPFISPIHIRRSLPACTKLK
jgi:hypothetical protein